MFKLTTEGGKSIRTTGNHPYLVVKKGEDDREGVAIRRIRGLKPEHAVNGVFDGAADVSGDTAQYHTSLAKLCLSQQLVRPFLEPFYSSLRVSFGQIKNPIINDNSAVMNIHNLTPGSNSAKNPLKHPPITTNLKISKNTADIFSHLFTWNSVIFTPYIDKTYHSLAVLSREIISNAYAESVTAIDGINPLGFHTGVAEQTPHHKGAGHGSASAVIAMKQSYPRLSLRGQRPKQSQLDAEWTKVIYLKPGDEIAVTDSLSTGVVAGATVTGGANLATTSGNVGIGTTGPAQKLHVEGQCVTGDTELAIFEVVGSRFKVQGIPIKDVQPGMMVYSLNEELGIIEPHRINALLDMGVKPVFKLTTKDGKSIKTTGNHPYLVVKQGGKDREEVASKAAKAAVVGSRFEVQGSMNASKLSFNSSEPLVDIYSSRNFSFQGFESRRKFATQGIDTFINGIDTFIKPFNFIIESAKSTVDFIVDSADFRIDSIETSFNTGQPRSYNVLYSLLNGFINIGNSHDNLLSIINHSIRNISCQAETSAYASLVSPLPGHMTEEYEFLEARVIWDDSSVIASPEATKPFDKSSGLRPERSRRTKQSLSDAEWTKVIYLLPGDFIAVSSFGMDFKKDSSNGTLEPTTLNLERYVLWAEIESIEYIGKEQVYDITVEGTQNFFGNGILAHNTYLNGNVGIGTTNPGSYKLYVSGSAYATGGWSGSDVRWKENIQELGKQCCLRRGARPFGRYSNRGWSSRL